jgi:hypothetical protein
MEIISPEASYLDDSMNLEGMNIMIRDQIKPKARPYSPPIKYS